MVVVVSISLTGLEMSIAGSNVSAAAAFRCVPSRLLPSPRPPDSSRLLPSPRPPDSSRLLPSPRPPVSISGSSVSYGLFSSDCAWTDSFGFGSGVGKLDVGLVSIIGSGMGPGDIWGVPFPTPSKIDGFMGEVSTWLLLSLSVSTLFLTTPTASPPAQRQAARLILGLRPRPRPLPR